MNLIQLGDNNQAPSEDVLSFIKGVYNNDIERQELIAALNEDNIEKAKKIEGGDQKKDILSDSENTVAYVMAASYLLENGNITATGYFLQALSGVFSNSTRELDFIRNKYLKIITDSNLGNLKEFIKSDLYGTVIDEIKNVIVSKYNNEEVNDILNTILKYPSGLPTKLGRHIEFRLEEIHSLPESISTSTIVEEKRMSLKRIKENQTENQTENQGQALPQLPEEIII